MRLRGTAGASALMSAAAAALQEGWLQKRKPETKVHATRKVRGFVFSEKKFVNTTETTEKVKNFFGFLKGQVALRFETVKKTQM